MLLCRICTCIAGFGMMLYLYLHQQNEVVRLRMRIPTLLENIHAVKEENVRLRYEIDRFENPLNLMQLAQKKEYSHLKSPYNKEVVSLMQGKDLTAPDRVAAALSSSSRNNL